MGIDARMPKNAKPRKQKPRTPKPSACLRAEPWVGLLCMAEQEDASFALCEVTQIKPLRCVEV